MQVSKDKIVTLTYELRNQKKGEIVDSSDHASPLSFCYGAGQMLINFEKNLLGLKAGEAFDFQLSPEQGYGIFSENAIIDLPITIFEVDGKLNSEMLKVGNIIPMQDNQGHRMNAGVLEVGEELVKMDFNHPMAGKDLFFSGSILDVREATEPEKEQLKSHANCEDCEHSKGCDEECN